MNDLRTDAVNANNFRNRLVKLDSHVNSDALQDFKFLLSDFVPQRALSQADGALAIFTELEKKGLLSQDKTRLVGECVCLAGLTHYLGLLGLREDEVKAAPFALSPFRRWMFEVASDLTKEDVEKMVYKFKIQQTRASSITNGLGLISHLEKSGSLGPKNLDVLLTGLAAIHREDLVHSVLEYKQGHFIVEPGRDMLRPPTGPVPPAPASAPCSEDSDEPYPMSRKPRGICLVINNQIFDPTTTNLKDRRGSEVDEGKLLSVFTNLHFLIRIYRNLTAEKMRDAMMMISRIDHKRFDCFVCCIMSHGSDGVIHGVDGQIISFESLISPLHATSCPTLHGKPKMFFFQACRGHVKQPGVPMEGDVPEEPDVPPSQLVTLEEPDFLLGFCTPSGYSSFRSTTMGSWYMMTLAEQLEKHAQSKDVLSILTLVNDKVANKLCLMEEQITMQVPAPVFSLTKKVLFS